MVAIEAICIYVAGAEGDGAFAVPELIR